MFLVFAVVQQLHEMLWYLEEIAQRGPEVFRARATDCTQTILRATHSGADELLMLNVDAVRTEVSGLLHDFVEQVALNYPQACDLRRADAAGKDLRSKELRGARCRGALLIGADLRGCDLTDADVLGADFRGARVCETDLSGSLFLTQAQLNAARGDAATRLPERLQRPVHWSMSGM